MLHALLYAMTGLRTAAQMPYALCWDRNPAAASGKLRSITA